MNCLINDILKKSNLSWLYSNTIFLTITGSTSYGLNMPDSDIDYKGVAIPPKKYFYSNNSFEQAEFKSPNPDCTIFNILKFFKLIVENNPNIIEVLWTEPEFYVITSNYFQKILENRDAFLCKNVRWRFSGYSISQIKRIERHYRWLKKDIPKGPPSRKEFNLPEKNIISKENFQAAYSIIQKKLDSWSPDFSALDSATRINVENKISDILTEICGASIYINKDDLWKEAAVVCGFDTNFIEMIQKEKEYKQKLDDWYHYQEWKQNRNPKRAELEAKFGYDCKNAVAVVRLMRMCEEILGTGKVIVKRPDREELLAIRNGLWTYEYLLDWAKKQDEKMDELYKNTTLPDRPNVNFLNNLCVEIIEEFLEKNKS